MEEVLAGHLNNFFLCTEILFANRAVGMLLF
jgi:hypothetical protein